MKPSLCFLLAQNWLISIKTTRIYWERTYHNAQTTPPKPGGTTLHRDIFSLTHSLTYPCLEEGIVMKGCLMEGHLVDGHHQENLGWGGGGGGGGGGVGELEEKQSNQAVFVVK